MECINLMFHDVFLKSTKESGFQGTGHNLYKISADAFETIVRQVATNQTKKFTFTFDDGGLSFYNVIAPILEKYGQKGIFFITTNKIGTEGFMTEAQISDLDKRGHLIGSHSHTHRELTSLSDAEVFNEWTTSKHILEHCVGHEIEITSIPGGYQSNSVLSMASKAGFRKIYTSVPTTSEYSFENLLVYGRFVIMSTNCENIINKLYSKSFRNYLFLRSKTLFLAQKILGSNYRKIRNLLYK